MSCLRCGARCVWIKANEPYHDGYYICVECDSTYPKEDWGEE
jgi:hypothetical protein